MSENPFTKSLQGVFYWPFVEGIHPLGLIRQNIENNVCTRVTNCFSAHERVILCLFPELRSNEGNKHHNNTRVSAETVRHESTYIILFLTRHNESINDDKNDDPYTLSKCFTHSVSFCCWRHNRLLMTSQWPDNYDAITWIVISNSLDIDFIHGDIHDRSCKKKTFLYLCVENNTKGSKGCCTIFAT